MFAIVKLALTLVFSLLVISMCFVNGWNKLGLGVTGVFLVEITSYLLTVTKNPGLANRDISIHKKSYLDKVLKLRRQKYCSICKLI